MNNYDMSIHQNPDAKAWAEFFMQTVKEQDWTIKDIDGELMFGWFANAMMARHDYDLRENEKVTKPIADALDDLINANENEAWRFPTVWDPKIGKIKDLRQKERGA